MQKHNCYLRLSRQFSLQCVAPTTLDGPVGTVAFLYDFTVIFIDVAALESSPCIENRTNSNNLKYFYILSCVRVR